MYLDHVSIYTFDLERLKDFYVKYFSGKSNDKYHNEMTGLQTYFITFDQVARLEIMFRPEMIELDKSVPTIGLTHLCFHLGSREKVDGLTEKLVEDGYTLKKAPRLTGDGYYESCVLDPDGNEVEILA